jgi:hypothetical protein
MEKKILLSELSSGREEGYSKNLLDFMKKLAVLKNYY